MQPLPAKWGDRQARRATRNYTQVTVYLRKQTHLAAKKRLLDEGREFSKLVEDLVSQWVFTNSENPKV